MRIETSKYLHDIIQAGTRIKRFCANVTFETYQQNDMLRAAVERQFEIIGEALNQLGKLDPETCNMITDRRQIIAFRNVLIHGYADVDDRLVWDVVQTRLDLLQSEATTLLNE